MSLNFEEIVKENQKMIYSLCYRFLGNHEDTDEAMQKTFMKAFEKIDTFQGKSSLKTWIYKIGVNVCRNILRSKKETLPLHFNLADKNASNPQEEIIEKEKRDLLKRELYNIPLKQRETIILRIYENYSFAEIAAILGQTENSAKVNYHLGMRKLKQIFEKKERQT